MATRSGIRTVGLSFRATGAPASTWWARHSARAWTAAYANRRGHGFFGDRELAQTHQWIDEIFWEDFKGYHHALHRPDMVIFTHDGRRVPVEVALTRPPGRRLQTTLGMYDRWRVRWKTSGVMYVCGNQDIAHHIRTICARTGLGAALNAQLVETMTRRAYEMCETERAARRSGSDRVLTVRGDRSN